MILIIDTFDFLPFLIISANLCRGDRRGVWFRVLCDVQRTHSTFLVGSGLQHVEKPRSSRKLPHFLLSNQQLCKFLIWLFDLLRR